MRKEEFFTHVPRAHLLERLEGHRTPTYLFFERLIARRVADARACLPDGVALHYAIKANPHPAILDLMNRLSLGADIASAGELRAAQAAGFPSQRVEYSGPGKTEEELALAVKADLGSINVESIPEIEALIRVSRRVGMSPRVGIRVNPASVSKADLRMAGATQFGISEDEAAEAIRAVANSDQLRFAGLHVHTGSQFLAAGALVENMRSILELALRLEADSGQAIDRINLGGGWGISYFPHQSSLSLEGLAQGMRDLLAQDSFARLTRRAQLIVEPGRFLVGEAGVYVAAVLYRKRVHGTEYAIIDGGMHDCYILAGGMGQTVRRNFELDILRVGGAGRPQKSVDINVAGVLCTPQDLLASRIHCEEDVEPGDKVVFFNCGAYGLSASPQAFLGHEPAQELLVP